MAILTNIVNLAKLRFAKRVWRKFKGDGKRGPSESDDFDENNKFGEDSALYKEHLL